MIEITVSKALDSFNFSSYFRDFHSGAGTGNPMFSGGSSLFDGDRITLDYQRADKEIILDGEDFQYTLSNHYLSGHLQEATYVADGKTELSITGLDLYTPPGKNTPVGPIVYGMMGDDPSGTSNAASSSTKLLQYMKKDAQHFSGSVGTDTYTGTRYDDIIEGNFGNDRLKGGAGDDTFVFDTKLDARRNVDNVYDFNVSDDTIELDRSIFTGVRAGKLSSGYFSDEGVAQDSNDRVIYNPDTGALLYDADGSRSGNAVQFATLSRDLDLTARDFIVT
jgi:hypothetical protein